MFRSFLPLIILFLVVNLILGILKILFPDTAFQVLLAGNMVLFLASLLSFYLYRRALLDKNPNVFIRLVYGGMILKMGICIAAALLYILLNKGGIRKNAILECFALYFLYTFVEVKKLMRLSKQQKNA
jgi:hypothetical protein